MIGLLERAETWKPGNAGDTAHAERPKLGETFGEMLLATDIKPAELILFSLRRGQIGLLNAIIGVGKTTLMRVLILCLLTGRQFHPLTVVKGRTFRVAVIDNEDSRFLFLSDMKTMMAGQDFTDNDRRLVSENLLVLCEREIDDSPLRLSNPAHLAAVVDRLVEFNPDFIVVDTLGRLSI